MRKYHRAARIDMPNHDLHAIIHAIVENQIALGHEPVLRAMSRLIAEGLSRHDAIHAVGSVLAERVFAVFHDSPADVDPVAGYDADLERLTADSRRNG